MDFDIKIPVRVISVKDSHKNNAFMLKGFGKKCVIVTGGKSALLSGALDDVKFALKECDIKYEIYDKIGPNPRIDHCHEAGEIARKFGAEFIVGIGGGSPLDAAKAVAVYATNPTFSAEDIFNFGENERNKALPLVLVGTTAGTGSEVGRVSVLTNPDTGRKRSIAPDDCFPTLTFADSKYTCSVPYSVTVSTALDAMAHAVESMFSPRADFLTQKFALIATEMIYPILEKLSKGEDLPTEEDRNTLYFASLYAGFALNKGGTGFPHGMGYALTEDYNVPHGLACAVFLPAYLKEAENKNPALYNELLKSMNATSEKLEKMIQNFCDFDFTIPQDKINEYEIRWENLKNFKNSPTEFNNKDAARLMTDLFVK